MPKRSNPRVQLVKDLRLLKSHTALLITRWSVSGKVWLTDAERKPGDNVYWRDRLPHEYPENSRDEWMRLADEAHEASQAWARLRDSAMNHARSLDTY